MDHYKEIDTVVEFGVQLPDGTVVFDNGRLRQKFGAVFCNIYKIEDAIDISVEFNEVLESFGSVGRTTVVSRNTKKMVSDWEEADLSDAWK